jgi:O-antigen ligase
VTALIKNRNFLFGVFATLFLVLINRAIAKEQYAWMAIPFVAILFYIGWQSIRTVFLILLFTLPFSIEYQVTGSLSTDFPDELLMVFASALFICHWAYNPSVISKQAWNHPLIVLLTITVGWAIVSATFSTEPKFSFKFLLAKGWYIGAFILVPLMLFKDKPIIYRSVWLVAIAMILVTIIALIRHALEGFAFASVNDAVQPFFRNHVNYSAMLVCIIPVVFIYSQSAKPGTMRMLSRIILIILLVALFLSYARGAWLALVAGIIAAWLIKRKLLVGVYITAIVILIASVFWLKYNDHYLRYAHDYNTTVWHEDFREHLRATYELKDASTAERFYRWIAGVRMVKDNPLTGYGPNSFYYNYKPYAIPAFKTWVSANYEHSTVHNYFLLITIEQGIPGLLFFLILTTAILFYAQRLYHRVHDTFYKRLALLSGVIIMMVLVVNFLSDLIETDKIGSIFFGCIALLISADINTRTAKTPNTPKT